MLEELESLLLQTNWSAIYQLFYQRYGIASLESLERGYVVKSAVEMTLSIVSKCFALLRSDPNGRLHCTPLHIAALQSSVEAAQVIVRDIPKQVEQTHHASHSALCPLHIAILCGSQAIVELLLDGSANPNVRSLHNVAPLHLAATSSKELCQLLLAYKADPLQRDVMGSTAAHYAAAFKQHPALEFMLGYISSPQRFAAEGDQKRVTPLHVACALFNSEDDLMGPMSLLSSGAKPWQADVSGATARDVVPPRAPTLTTFFESCGDRAQAAAQRWLEERTSTAAERKQDQWADDDDDDDNTKAAGPVLSENSSPRKKPASQKVALEASSASSEYKEQEQKLQAEVVRLTQELDSLRVKAAELERVTQDLEHAKQRCQVLEQSTATANQAMQSLCDQARSQHQQQLEEVQRRHQQDRLDWEERMKMQVESARVETRLEAARQTEAMHRELDQRRQEVEARLRSAEVQAAEFKAAAIAAEERAQAATTEAERQQEHAALSRTSAAQLEAALKQKAEEVPSPARGASAQLQAKVEALEAESRRMGRLLEEQDSALDQQRRELSEVTGANQALIRAIAALGANIGIQPPSENGSTPEPHALLAAIGSEFDRLCGFEAEVQALRGEIDTSAADATAQREHIRQLQEEAERLRKQRSEAQDFCDRLKVEVHEAETRGSATVVQLESKLKDLELRSAQALDSASSQCEAQRRRADAAEAQVTDVQAQLATIDGRHASSLRRLQTAFDEEQQIRKKYHNQLQDMKGAIRVFCRIRPFAKREQDLGDRLALRKADAFSVELARPPGSSGAGGDKRAFQFDSIFEGDASQEEVFDECRELVRSAVDGYNVTIFAYGQTGSGKTHTMYGSPEQPGLTPRSIRALFDTIRRAQEGGGKTFKVKAYMVEIYKQDIIDLLASKPQDKKSLEVKKDLGRGIMYVEGATTVPVTGADELLAVLVEADKKRHVTATKMNSQSSRSHLLLSIIIECSVKQPEQVIFGKITLCDLAGSERPKKSEVSGEGLKEAIEINKSLSALGDVIEALTKGSKQVPYRNHKLTMLMQDSLGGTAKTLMFVNCSPASSNVEETQMSLKWASRARQVTNEVKRNADSKEVARLKQVIAMMSAAQSATEGQDDEGGASGDAVGTAALRAGLGLAS